MLHKVNRRNSLLLVSPFFTQRSEEREEEDIKSTEKVDMEVSERFADFPT